MVSLVAVLAGLLVTTGAKAQINNTSQLTGQINTISTAVPFLRITADARAGAMGDAGIATSADANSIYWNPAKLSFAENNVGLTASYTPWLRQLVNDIYLANISGYKHLDKNQTLAVSLLYFDLGSITFTNITGVSIGDFNPHEFVTSIAYARKLSDYFSAGIGLKFIYSNLAAGQNINGSTIKPGKAAAADISIYYEKDIKISDYKSKFAFGTNISNVGSKITYTESIDKDFIPINLGIGTAVTMEVDDYNDITFAFDINKLLVPTPDTLDADGGGIPDFKEKGVVSGMFGSFGDAPGGFSEEIAELMFSFGLEYWYSDQFAIRAGYFNEHSTKGNRKYLTAGLGLKLNVFGLNVSYLIPSNSQRNPLDNTLRFTLLFNFDKEKDSPTTP
ncbi:MAG: type IX secretion system outer membrane channel protein PorV [Bacteroidetes bacterium]|nr:type IX secretion system outer membrane channel protein PorV [Bacteroidota bacterium]